MLRIFTMLRIFAFLHLVFLNIIYSQEKKNFKWLRRTAVKGDQKHFVVWNVTGQQF